ncbi:hypothetical protein ABMC88_01755 [Sulfitobacter sp. HNIBRBA2951]|uniref:hypothetical protein n=1 Tax=Sulfitobacter aquimarinus TaxID=3158557 RepID=UPI0032DF2A49
MTNAITIPHHESGVIRVFAISRPISTVARQLKQQPKAALASDLLAHEVKPDMIELFALSDLTGVGLSRYLADGYDIAPDALRSDHLRLEGLDGYVLLLFSTIAEAATVTLQPHADLTLVGTYAEPKPAHAARPIPSDAAKPYSGTSDSPTAPNRSRVGSALTVVGALVIAFLIWWIM